MIPKSELINGVYYRGVHRCGNVALWDANRQEFWYVEYSMGRFGMSTCKHPEDDDGFALFVPFERLHTKPTDAECIEAAKWNAK